MSSIYIVTPNLTAQGNINPSVFVKLDTSNNLSVLQAGAGDATFGVMWEGTLNAPGTSADAGYAATSGDGASIYGPGSVCLLAVGSGGWTAGDLLKSDASGNGITTTTSGDKIGAVALETGSYGEFRQVLVLMPGSAVH